MKNVLLALVLLLASQIAHARNYVSDSIPAIDPDSVSYENPNRVWLRCSPIDNKTVVVTYGAGDSDVYIRIGKVTHYTRNYVSVEGILVGNVNMRLQVVPGLGTAHIKDTSTGVKVSNCTN